MPSEELLNRFWPHVPESENDPVIRQLERVRLDFLEFAENIKSLDGDPRYKTLAQTALEECAMWTTKLLVSGWDLAPFPNHGVRADDREHLQRAELSQQIPTNWPRHNVDEAPGPEDSQIFDGSDQIIAAIRGAEKDREE